MALPAPDQELGRLLGAHWRLSRKGAAARVPQAAGVEPVATLLCGQQEGGGCLGPMTAGRPCPLKGPPALATPIWPDHALLTWPRPSYLATPPAGVLL